MEEDFTEEQKEQAEKQAEEQKKIAERSAEDLARARQSEWDNIGKQRDYGFLTSEEAYKKQLEWIQKYCPEYSEEWDSYYQEVISYEKNARKEQLNGVKESLSDTLDEYKKAYSELETSAKSYKNKLLSVGDLFAITTETDENGSERKVYSVENIREQMNEMRKYNDYVKSLKARGVSNEVLAELTSYDFDDGMIFAENLSKMSDSELQQISDAYAERDKLAEDLSNELFDEDKEKLNQEFKDTMLAELGTLPEDVAAIGADALDAFILSITDSGDLTEGAAEFIGNFFTACSEGIDSGEYTSALGDSLSAAFGEQDTYALGKEKGEDFVTGFMEAYSAIFSEAEAIKASVSADITSGKQEQTTTAAAAGNSGSANTGTNSENTDIHITVDLDGDKIGETSYRYTKNKERRENG